MNRRVLILLPWYLPAYRAGGPIRTIAALVNEHQADRFAIITGDRDWGAATPLDVATDRWVDVGPARVRYCSSRPGPLRSLRSWSSALLATARPDILYLNGVFPVLSSMLPAALRRAGLLRPDRLVIAPRGEFGPGALALRPLRKRAFLSLARAVGLHSGAVWHASTPREADEIRQVLGDVDVVVRENETLLPPEPLPRSPRAPGPLRVIFLSRVSEKKGLHVVLDALRHVTEPVQLDVYGNSDDAAYLSRCEELAAHLSHPVRFHGAVEQARVADAFAGADVFAFPTASENFGHAIAEALAAACPVLVPDTTPWTELLRDGGGEVVDGHHDRWSDVLAQWAIRSPLELDAAASGAAEAYRRWRNARPSASVFDLIDAAANPATAASRGA